MTRGDDSLKIYIHRLKKSPFRKYLMEKLPPLAFLAGLMIQNVLRLSVPNL